MSLSNALNSAVSGLKAQSAALSSISSNIANSSTVGFKGTSTTFESFVNKSTFTTEATGGVVSSNVRNVGLQGDIQTSTTTTNLAVNGSGFFVVSDETADGAMRFTRNGTFDTDAEGYLANEEGDYLYGWPLDEDGNIATPNSSSLNGLEAINLANLTGAPKATSEIAFGANLPSDAATILATTLRYLTAWASAIPSASPGPRPPTILGRWTPTTRPCRRIPRSLRER